MCKDKGGVVFQMVTTEECVIMLTMRSMINSTRKDWRTIEIMEGGIKILGNTNIQILCIQLGHSK